MKYVDEFRDNDLVADLTGKITENVTGSYKFMEVCGGHTAAIHRFGINTILPETIRLISGPGCPVCVTGTGFIDRAVLLTATCNNIIATFGDMMRIPGSKSTLEKERACGADIRLVFSALDALQIAVNEPGKRVIFLGIGFETTAPGTAATILEAHKKHIRNFYVLCAHKVMPPAMEMLVRDGTQIDGFICPGHVSAITGSSAFDFISSKYGIGCVVTGFEPLDMLQSIYMLIRQVNDQRPLTEIQYRRAVTLKGNLHAQKLMNDVFEPDDVYWRGLGIVPSGGLKIREKFRHHDARFLAAFREDDNRENAACICGEILKGARLPTECSLFAGTCNPENPVGACMVSPEGSCNTYYKYRRER